MLYIVKKVQKISTDLRFQFLIDSYYHYRCISVYYAIFFKYKLYLVYIKICGNIKIYL